MTTSPETAAVTTVDRKLRITVLAGGPSLEREISLESGAAIADALRRRGHDVHVRDIQPNDLAALDEPVDVVFPALHGTFGEDGTLQRILERRHLPFVGCGSDASRLAMDKVASKQLAKRLGIPTAPWEVWDTAQLKRQDSTSLDLPVIVKPIDQGSSVGAAVVQETSELLPAVREAVAQFGRTLVEQFVVGDELTVGVVGGRSLPPICIRTRRGFYDYDAKYRDDTTEYLFDADIPDEVLQQARLWSEQLFGAMGCLHLSRLDWMLGRDNRLFFLEANTLPGFTTHSVLPKAADRTGVSFDELVERLAWLGLEESR